MTSQELVNSVLNEIWAFQGFSQYTEQEFKLLEDNVKNLLEEYFNENKI